jgi:Heterokaryon incompatibility protein (HET)
MAGFPGPLLHTSPPHPVDTALLPPRFGDNLCARCAVVDLDKVLSSQPLLLRGQPIFYFANSERDFSPDCPLCQLLRSITPRSQRTDSQIYTLFVRCPRLRVFGLDEFMVFLGVLPMHDFWAFQMTSSCYIFSTTPPATTGNQQVTGKSREISAAVNFDLIRKWLRNCETKHSSCQPSKAQAALSIQLIDCRTRRIVQADTQSRYVALSYVWGPSKADSAESKPLSQLPHNLPRTIEDTVTVAKILGLQYVWIDRYCIPQRDEKAKHDQIAQMDRIYRSAQLTVVAAAGDDPSHGLPGVGQTPRKPQPQATIGKHKLVCLMEDPQVLINRSKWITRAWTYQEALCSKRLLVFTEEQVYFECATTNLSETADYDPKSEKSNISLGTQRAREPWTVLNHISDYSKRALTYDSDALNGMLGVLRVFGEAEYPVRHFWGVPVLPPVKRHRTDFHAITVKRSATEGFVSGLCWKSHSPGRRRAGFPSWSWTGWTGVLRTVSSEYENRDNFMSSLPIQISLPGRTGTMVDFETFWGEHLPDGPHIGLPTVLRITAPLIDLVPVDHSSPENFYVHPRTSSKLHARLCLIENVDFCSERFFDLRSSPIKGIIMGNLRNVEEYGVSILAVSRSNQHTEQEIYERCGHLHLLGMKWHDWFSDVYDRVLQPRSSRAEWEASNFEWQLRDPDGAAKLTETIFLA